MEKYVLKESKYWDIEGWKLPYLTDLVFLILEKFYNSNLFSNTIMIYHKHSTMHCCKLLLPCACVNRKNICIMLEGNYPGQYVFQLSHELCHCTNPNGLPIQLKWFDEFLSCFTSYFVLRLLSQAQNPYKNIFLDYLNMRLDGHIYTVINTKTEYDKYKNLYQLNHNLVKKHDFFWITFHEMIKDNFGCLSIIAKIKHIRHVPNMELKDVLMQLSLIAIPIEKIFIEKIALLFGIAIYSNIS